MALTAAAGSESLGRPYPTWPAKRRDTVPFAPSPTVTSCQWRLDARAHCAA
ncbi:MULTISPECIES: hypothetical protein [Burkholderia]|uniref:Uncharacterized protein n=1 Tax=Burkholderia sola TaxID=2843302 RepID=A0ABV2CBU8_9BURK|nr:MULTISPECIES: hypothetical protein [Burkholderia]QRR14786.1 hypothetical protein GJG85_15675 [Burkholderia sp. MS389]CAG2296961.1 hypothetical protein BCCR75389_03042 [Burkholderia cenocepacia]CAG2297254.1 hypothetical protein BCCR75386_03058 [Burkholderia cenocepacia]CAG2297667.1 hypothetical protein BCCR75388_03060 [Burkholderia cenocepacia]CAG2297755.1 hypothetical protein BCCR75384_03057 [Burkholderia cenocepacia]